MDWLNMNHLGDQSAETSLVSYIWYVSTFSVVLALLTSEEVDGTRTPHMIGKKSKMDMLDSVDKDHGKRFLDVEAIDARAGQ